MYIFLKWFKSKDDLKKTLKYLFEEKIIKELGINYFVKYFTVLGFKYSDVWLLLILNKEKNNEITIIKNDVKDDILWNTIHTSLIKEIIDINNINYKDKIKQVLKKIE